MIVCVHPNETLTEVNIPQPIYWPLLALPTIGLMSPARRAHMGEAVRSPAVWYCRGSNSFSHGEMGSLLGVQGLHAGAGFSQCHVPTLESKTSWSLRSSLSRYNMPHSQVAMQAEPVHGKDNTHDSCTGPDISSKDTVVQSTLMPVPPAASSECEFREHERNNIAVSSSTATEHSSVGVTTPNCPSHKVTAQQIHPQPLTSIL